MSIRPAAPADFEAIYAIWLAGIEHSFAGFPHPPDLSQQFHHNFATCQPPFGFWVAEEAGEVVGWQSLLPCTCNPLKRHLMAESSTYVAAGARGRGVAKLLLSYVLAEAQKLQLQFVLGYVSAGNVRMASIVKAVGFELGLSPIIPEVPPYTEAKDLWIYTVKYMAYNTLPPPPQLIIRAGHMEDLAQLQQLNAYWQRERVSSPARGFIRGVVAAAEWDALLTGGQVAVAAAGTEVAGYYLVNPVTKAGITAIQRARLPAVWQAHGLPGGARVGVGAQACLLPAYQGQGLLTRLLQQLLQQVACTYDYLFATISKDNAAGRRAHTKDGWQFVDEDDSRHYVLLPVPGLARPGDDHSPGYRHGL